MHRRFYVLLSVTTLLVSGCGARDEPPLDPQLAESGEPGGGPEAMTLADVKGRPSDVPAPNLPKSEIECMAMSLYHEARAEPDAGLRAVGHVILNRMASERYPDTVCAVTKQGGSEPPCQFSWFCDGRSDAPREAEAWRDAQTLARRLLTEQIPDVTDGATSFHLVSVSPGWANRMERTTRIGRHIFYRPERG